MPTHRGSSGRASLSSADQFRTIQESTKLCEQVLENVSRVISESKQNAIINEKMAQEWSEEIIALANANVAIDDAVSYAKRNLETFENDADNSTDRKAVVKKIKSDVLKLSKTDTSKSKFVTSIGRILQVEGAGDDDDEDIVMMVAADKHSDFKCPYTAQDIDIPMKNTTCSHVISQRGLNDMIRVKAYCCPVGGCKSRWSKSTATVDTVFQKRMQRFQRVQEQTQTAGTQEMIYTEL